MINRKELRANIAKAQPICQYCPTSSGVLQVFKDVESLLADLSNMAEDLLQSQARILEAFNCDSTRQVLAVFPYKRVTLNDIPEVVRRLLYRVEKAESENIAFKKSKGLIFADRLAGKSTTLITPTGENNAAKKEEGVK